MNLTTQINIPHHPHPITYDSYVMSWGSCFAESMGEKFSYYKIPSTVNPFGILFHPLAIERIIKRVVEELPFTEKDIFYHNEQWHSFEVHSCVSHSDKDVFLNRLNEILAETKSQLLKTTHFIITYGTAWVYRLKETQQYVANCHKVPQNQFDKEILSIGILEKCIHDTTELIQSINPDIQIIFTISPVRHLKDGFVENQRSKAHLISVIHKIVLLKKVTYFPSYEIMMDELRDYRFYAEDMIHPSGVAIAYIWERFQDYAFNLVMKDQIKKVNELQKMIAHKPFNITSESYQQLLLKIESKKNDLEKNIPGIVF